MEKSDRAPSQFSKDLFDELNLHYSDLVPAKSKSSKKPKRVENEEAENGPFNVGASPITRVLNDIDMYLHQVDDVDMHLGQDQFQDFQGRNLRNVDRLNNFGDIGIIKKQFRKSNKRP